ncbi:PREDICTED: T-cell antigen CD7 [Dipodomys ordii]|uniref:T-cell antigen CD7 n=1 Tax=Dipodomys ordii TaxID=10020 RepID=A0A1S3GIC2_DIPOR|nr:PREDICTED: T-cell antigen CD7 [Dipodomys ordii]
MIWLTLPALLLTMVGAQEVQQSPLYAAAPEGASVSLVCLTRGALFGGVFLERRWPTPANVIYFEDQVEPTVDRAFRGRIAFSGTQSNLTISMSLLTPNDSGVYACRAASERRARSPGTMVAVTGEGQRVKSLSGDQSSPSMVYEDMSYRGGNQQRR